jgi:hypothetical protein
MFAVLMAEVVHHYFPKLVELHNYSSANSHKQKMYNWATLNRESALARINASRVMDRRFIRRESVQAAEL